RRGASDLPTPRAGSPARRASTAGSSCTGCSSSARGLCGPTDGPRRRPLPSREHSCDVERRVRRMPLFSFEGLRPRIHATAFVAPTATLVGDVIIEENASVWYGVVIRADYAPVIVRERANGQDNAVIHGSPGLTTDVGEGVTIGHNCVVHGALLEKECI